MYIGFSSDVLPANNITDYLTRSVQPKLQSVEGIQTAELLGSKNFSMRAWLDPNKLAAYALTASDVSTALTKNDFIAGLGTTKGQMVQVNLTASTSLHSVAEFENLIIKQQDGAIIRLKDVANVTLGADDYVTTSCRNHAGAADETVNQEGQLVCVRAECFQREVGTGAHFVVVVSGDVHGEQFGLAGFVLRALHRVVHQRQHFLDRAEHLVALRLVVLDEVAAQPELVSRLGERLGTQTQLRLDDGAGDVAAVLDRTTQDAPQVGDVGGRAVELLDQRARARRSRCILACSMSPMPWLLPMASVRKDTSIMRPSVTLRSNSSSGYAMRMIFVGFVDVVNQRVNALGEVVGGGNFHVGAGGRFGGEVRSGFQIAEAGPWASSCKQPECACRP